MLWHRSWCVRARQVRAAARGPTERRPHSQPPRALSASNDRFGESETLAGWLYKRAPRERADAHERRVSGSSTSHATASASMRALNNLLVPSKQLWQRRWIAEDAERSLLVYYKTKPREDLSRRSRAGARQDPPRTIHSVSTVSTDPKDADRPSSSSTSAPNFACFRSVRAPPSETLGERRQAPCAGVGWHDRSRGGPLSRGASFREAEHHKHEIGDDAAAQWPPLPRDLLKQGW